MCLRLIRRTMMHTMQRHRPQRRTTRPMPRPVRVWYTIARERHIACVSCIKVAEVPGLPDSTLATATGGITCFPTEALSAAEVLDVCDPRFWMEAPLKADLFNSLSTDASSFFELLFLSSSNPRSWIEAMVVREGFVFICKRLLPRLHDLSVLHATASAAMVAAEAR